MPGRWCPLPFVLQNLSKAPQQIVGTIQWAPRSTLRPHTHFHQHCLRPSPRLVQPALCTPSADLPSGPGCLGRGPWLATEIRSTHKVIDKNSPLRSLAAGNKVVLHLCCMRNPGCCIVERVCLMWLLWCCAGSTVD